jgi:hypothetical protein
VHNGKTTLSVSHSWCFSGFTGDNCSVNFDDCMLSPCADGATCADEVDDFTCYCPPGFTSKTCDVRIGDCSHSDCVEPGFCEDLVEGYQVCLVISSSVDRVICIFVTAFYDNNASTLMTRYYDNSRRADVN